MTSDPFDGLLGSHTDRPQVAAMTASAHASYTARLLHSSSASMLIPDLQREVMRGLRDWSSDVVLRVSPPSIREVVVAALPRRRAYAQSMGDRTQEYLQVATRALLSGPTYVEIEYFSGADSSNTTPTQFKLNVLRCDEVAVRRRRRYRLQGGSRPGNTHTGRLIDDEELITIELPRKSRKSILSLLELLWTSDEQMGVASDYVMGRFGDNSGFEFSKYQEMNQDLLLRASRSIGWTSRGLMTGEMLEPYLAWRAIQFAAFAAELRDAAMVGLESALKRVGTRMGFSADVLLTSALSPQDFQEMRRAISLGTASLSDLKFSKSAE